MMNNRGEQKMKNETSLWGRIKAFFSRIFSSKKLLEEAKTEVATPASKNIIESNDKNIFAEAGEKNKWLDLQKLYLQGKVKEEDMTSEQISALEKLFDSQIETAKRANENKKIKILKALMHDSNIMDVYEKVQKGEIAKDQLTKDQIIQVGFLYKENDLRQRILKKAV